MSGQPFVGGGVPFVVVDAVEDAVNVEGAMMEEAVEVGAAVGGHDFAGVGGADGVDHGGVVDAAGHEVDLAVVLFGEGVGLEAEIVEDFPGGEALMGEVVDGEDGGHGPEVGVIVSGGCEPS